MARELTDKQKAFCEEYIKNGYNGTKAYQEAYGQDNAKMAAKEACRMLKDTRIQEELDRVEGSFAELGRFNGLDKKTIVNILAEMTGAMKSTKFGIEPDYIARNNAITTFAKLAGIMIDKRKVTIEDDSLKELDPSKLSAEERKEMEKELLNNL